VPIVEDSWAASSSFVWTLPSRARGEPPSGYLPALAARQTVDSFSRQQVAVTTGTVSVETATFPEGESPFLDRLQTKRSPSVYLDDEVWRLYASGDTALLNACRSWLQPNRGGSRGILALRDLHDTVSREARVPVLGSPPFDWSTLTDVLKQSPPLAAAVTANANGATFVQTLLYYSVTLVSINFVSPAATIASEAMQQRLRRRWKLPVEVEELRDQLSSPEPS
jgi:hypothetical protein